MATAGHDPGVGVSPFELRVRRRALGMTQAELSVALGVSANTIARWERGELPIGSPLLLRLALERLAAAAPPAREEKSWRGHRTTEASEPWPALGEVPQVPGT